MIVSDIFNTLKAEKAFGRTPSGRSITEYAKNAIDATIEDEKNWQAEVMKCLNCNYVNSGLQFPEGCINCGGHDLSSDINQSDVM